MVITERVGDAERADTDVTDGDDEDCGADEEFDSTAGVDSFGDKLELDVSLEGDGL